MAQNTLCKNATGWKRNFQYAIFVLEFVNPFVSNRGFDPQYVNVFDRYATSTRNLLGMPRFNPLKWAFVLSLKWPKKTQKITFMKYLSCLNSQANLWFGDSSRNLKTLYFLGKSLHLGTLALLQATNVHLLPVKGKIQQEGPKLWNFNTQFGKDQKPVKIRPATQNTQRVEISIRNATRRKRNGSGPLRSSIWIAFVFFIL